MKTFKKVLNYIFIDGLSGMALGLFATLIIGTILQQIGILIGSTVGDYLYLFGRVAGAMMSAGIGVGVALKFKAPILVVLSAAVAATIGGYATSMIAGTLYVDGVLCYAGYGEPMSAFIAALVGITVGKLVSGKTKVDILVTPLVTILSGATVGLLVGPKMSSLMTSLGALVNWGTEQQPLLMGIIVAVLMGMFLTMPISSAAIGVILNLSGLAAGAATIGCCCNMVGFAVASYRENKMSGLLAQGIGTSMLQVPNIVKKPIIWLPSILASAILGPIATVVLQMENVASGSGMGTAGLVGQITTWQTMSGSMSDGMLLLEIVLMHFVLPAALALTFSEILRKTKLIQFGDMKLDL